MLRARPGGELLLPLLLLGLALSAFLPASSFVLESTTGQAVMETAAALISSIAALLFAGRFWRHLRLRDLLLAGGLAIVAVSKIGADLLLAGNLVIGGHSGAWLVTGGRLAGWILIAASAVAGDRRLRRPTPGELRGAAAAIGALAAVAALVVALYAHVTTYEAHVNGPLGDPAAILAAEILLTALASFAALAFRVEAIREDSPPARLLALACAFAAAAALASCATPAIYASRLDMADVLRLGWLVALFACVCVEWSLDERRASVHALEHERRRMAADVHDLIMQDLSFALAGARALADDPARGREAETVVSAGERALAGARDVLSALTEQSAQPIARALESSVRIAARHTPLTFAAGGVGDTPAADNETRNALIHIGREAVTNAVKHGRAREILVELAHDDEWRLTVRDDGRGFDPAGRGRGGDPGSPAVGGRGGDPGSPPVGGSGGDPGGPDVGGFGLASMRHHAETLGGSLQVYSGSHGTTIEAWLP
ncbi:MAG TPA: ATP-binding protein [Solirubrobacteraceae bacterium]|nr:ATP-binding protein [Solirubrobacteraceae bacterium]